MKILAIIADTLRQTISKGTLIFYFGMSTVTILVIALGFNSATVDGTMTFSFFGNVIPKEAAPKFLEFLQVRAHFCRVFRNAPFRCLCDSWRYSRDNDPRYN